jgi:hypothetical protein
MNLEDKWKKAIEDLNEFNRMIELIKKYPIKSFTETKCKPYEIEPPIQYPKSFTVWSLV